jgi:hypothetical protein
MAAITLSNSAPIVTLSGFTTAYGTVSAVIGENAPVEAAIFGPASTAFDVTNTGTILSPGTSPFDAGIVLGAAGEVHNAGDITAPAGIFILGAAAGAYAGNTGTIHATAGDGVYLKSAGLIYNTGQISAAGTAIALAGGGTVIDKGGISGSSAGIVFADGFSNNLILDTGATVTGNIELYGTLALTGGGGIFSLSQVQAASTIAIAAGSNWSFYGSVSGAPDIFNRGAITAPISGLGGPGETVGDGIDGGGAVYNYGSITGGIVIATAGRYVYNAGGIQGENGGPFAPKSTGIDLLAPGAVVNTGTISAHIGVKLASSAALYNYGQISGGVRSSGAATVFNYAGGTIKGGVKIAAGTITDYGLIAGRSGAVVFGKSAANLLALGATATLSGGAFLGGGGIELLAGPQPGTFTAASYTDFSALTIADAADWSVIGSLAASIAVTNDGTIGAPSGPDLTIDGALSGGGAVDLPGTLTLNGEVGAGQRLIFTGTAETLNLGAAKSFLGELESFAPGDTIDLTSLKFASITATHFARGVLTISTDARDGYSFTFASPRSFHNDTFSLFADGTGTGITLAPAAALAEVSKPAGWPANTHLPSAAAALSLVTLQT